MVLKVLAVTVQLVQPCPSMVEEAEVANAQLVMVP